MAITRAANRFPKTAHEPDVAPPAESPSLIGRLRAVLTGDVFVNLVMVAALAVGFFHGWLKIKFRSPATTFLFDIAVLLAVGVVFSRAGSLRRFFPDGKTAVALIGFYGLCVAYMPVSMVPGMPPFLVALSTLRGWIFGTFLFGLGYQIIRNRSQMHGYFLIILALSLATAIYGIRQSDDEVLQMMKEDAFFARRYRGQGYVDAEGDFHVRRFSTFISSGAFGATMATAIIFGSALFLAPKTRLVERVLIGAAMMPMGYGMLLSGARSATITAFGGILTLLAFRRKLALGLVIAGVIAVGALLASQATGGGVFDRLGTLNFQTIFYRFWWPTWMGLDYMSTHPLGGGIGRTGAAPTFIKNMSDFYDYYPPDGDLGRLMVEFGILGLLVFGRVVWHSATSMHAAVRATAATESGSLVLAAAINLWISIAFIGIGSPFVGIPMGVLVWFFVGGAERLREIELAALAVPESASSLTATPPALGPSRGPGQQRSMAAAPEHSSGPRRFLYAGPAEFRRTPDAGRPRSAQVAVPAAAPAPDDGASHEPSTSGSTTSVPAPTPKKHFLYASGSGKTRAKG